MTHTRYIFCLLTAMIGSIASWANDGIYYTSGNELVPLQETNIKVSKEVLTISLLDNHMAKVDVDYEFYNPSDSTKNMLMGFEADPSYNDNYTFYPNGVHPHINNFSVSINGTSLSYKNAVCELGNFKPLTANQWKLDDEGGTSLINKTTGQCIDRFAYVYYFNVTFKPGANHVRHTYLYTMSVSVGTTFEVPYKLSPAGRWAGGQIGDFTLIIKADSTAKHFYVNQKAINGITPVVTQGTGKVRAATLTYNDDPKWEVSLRNGSLTTHATDFCPDKEHELYICSADAASSYDESAPFGAFYDRSSAMVLEQWPNTNHKQRLSQSFMKRIAHNLPYANRGHVFKDAKLKQYFESLWWYMPDPTYRDNTADFTKSDWQYVRF